MNITERAKGVFAEAASQIAKDCKAMMAEHSAAGRLQSGATVIRAVEIFETRSTEALTQILDEVSKQIETRGTQWNEAMGAIGLALREHVGNAPAILEPPFKVSGIIGKSGEASAMQRIEAASSNLQNQLDAFRQGWTSPPSKPWNERHPVKWALGLMLLSSLTGAVAGWAVTRFTDQPKEGGDVDTLISAMKVDALMNRVGRIESNRPADYATFTETGTYDGWVTSGNIAINVQLAAIKPSAKGSVVELSVLNPMAVALNRCHLNIDWGETDNTASKAFIKGTARSEMFAIGQPLGSAQRVTLSYDLPGIAPARLGRVTVGDLMCLDVG